MKNLNSVKVLFNNPEYNYSTNVSAESTKESAEAYFIGKSFDLGYTLKKTFKNV